MDIQLESLFTSLVRREGQWSEVAAKLTEIKLQIKALSATESTLKDQLIQLSENQSSYDENGYVFKMYESKGQVDYLKIPELIGVDLEQYRKKMITSWRIDKIL